MKTPLRHSLKNSVNKESSGSQFFRTTTGIQSAPDAFGKSRFIMTFPTKLGVTEILCSFKLVLEGKGGKEMPELLRCSSQKSFQQTILLYRMQKTTPPAVGQRRYSRFTFVENAISNSPKFLRTRFLGSSGIFCFISICKFGSFKNPFTTNTSLSELQIQKIYPFGTNKKSDFYELWQQHKQLQTMEMSEA